MEGAAQPAVLGLKLGDRVVLLAGGPAVGLALGWVLPRVADWTSKQTWVPFQNPLGLIASWDQSWVPFLLLGLGALAGLAFALYAMWETLTVTVNEQKLSLTAKGKQRTFTKDQIAAAFFDADRLVLLGHDTHELPARSPM